MKQEIIDGNVLIAEFMGMEKRYDFHTEGHLMLATNNFAYLADPKNDTHDEFMYLEYDSNWNWLMPVVEKIEAMDHVVKIYLNSCFIQSQFQFIANKADYISKHHSKISKIDAVYKAVTAFIKWYNETQSTN